MDVYYVVKRGYTPGIYKTWLECKKQVDGFKNPTFKKFNSFTEANEFYKSSSTFISTVNVQQTNVDKTNEDKNNLTTTLLELEKIKQTLKNIKSITYHDYVSNNSTGVNSITEWNCIENEIYIFTDGSSRKSKEYLNSGIGVYFGYKCLNIKEQYNNKTNNFCELQAMDYAFKIIIKHSNELIAAGKVIKIVSDSEYTIKACSLWLVKWKQNNWCTTTGDEVKNRDLIESIDNCMTKIKLINSKIEDENKKIRVKLIHVNSHQMPNLQDNYKFNIWYGNYVADALSQNLI